jgi:hypothetical protein
MSDAVNTPEVAGTDEEKKAARAKRAEVSQLRMKLKFLDAEMERHTAMRKEIRASLEGLGATKPAGSRKPK